VKLRQSLIALVQNLIEGIHSQYGSSAKLTISTGTYTSKELAGLLQRFVDSHAAKQEARAHASSALVAHLAAAEEVVPVAKALKAYLEAVLVDPKERATFGLKLRKVRNAPDTETLFGAIRKREATREARHTLGRRRKLQIHGAATSEAPAPGGNANGVTPVTPAAPK
jgi:hypothetical protein